MCFRIIDQTACAIHTKWRHLLWPGDVTRINKNLKAWAAAINAAGIGIPPNATNVFGFVDGTQREVCLPDGPTIVGEAFINGHKHFPSAAYIGLLSPDGLFAQFAGPYMGWEHDHSVFKKSRLYDMLDQGLFVDEDGKRYRPFADLGYFVGPNILTGFKEANEFAHEVFNTTWSRQRVFVECGFGDVTNTFKIHQFLPLQKPNKSRLAVWYLVSVLLTNCQVCLYGSKAADHFNCPPPSLTEYLKVWDDDPQFAAVYDRFRPDEFWCMRTPEEKMHKYNTGKAEWEKMQEEEKKRTWEI